jgi:hypothetical protein
MKRRSLSLGCAALLLAAPLAPPLSAQEEEADDIVPSQAPCIWVEDGETPLQVVQWLYKPEPRPDWSSGQCAAIGEALGNAYIEDAMRQRDLDDPIGRIGFDFIVNGQDALITQVEVTEEAVGFAGPQDPERTVITASFKNFDSPNIIDYYWVKQDDEWTLEEVVSRSPEFPWVLSLLLKYGR